MGDRTLNTIWNQTIEVGTNKSKDFQAPEPYRLEAFRVYNYKAFHDSGWIQINHLTLFLGENSAGKSALYQVLAMVKKCFVSLNEESIFSDTQMLEDAFGTFDEMRNKCFSGENIRFAFRFREDRTGELVEYEIALQKSEKDLSGVVASAIVRCIYGEINLLEFYRSKNIFFLERRTEKYIPEDIAEVAGTIMTSLRSFAGSYRSIAATRTMPGRMMEFTGTGAESDDAYEVLFGLSELERGDEAYIQDWLGKFGYRYRFHMVQKNRGAFMLENLKTKHQTNIVDNGYGIAQSLPVAVELMRAEKHVLMIDSPEAFLQTKMQSEMGDLLLKGASKGYVMAETSSEYLVLRVQRRITEKQFPAESVSIYFIDENDCDYAECTPVEIGENGKYVGAPKHLLQFFSSDFDDLEKMNEARRTNAKNCN